MDSDYRGVAEQCFEKGETSPKGTYFRESHAGEVPRIHLLGTWVNESFLGRSPTSRPTCHPPPPPSRTDPRIRPLPRTGVAPPRSPPKLPHAPTRATQRAFGGAPQTTLARSER